MAAIPKPPRTYRSPVVDAVSILWGHQIDGLHSRWELFDLPEKYHKDETSLFWPGELCRWRHMDQCGWSAFVASIPPSFVDDESRLQTNFRCYCRNCSHSRGCIVLHLLAKTRQIDGQLYTRQSTGFVVRALCILRETRILDPTADQLQPFQLRCGPRCNCCLYQGSGRVATGQRSERNPSTFRDIGLAAMEKIGRLQRH